ncbi:MAG: alpha/beta hydrolase [Flavobacteriales bacterium]|nr:alpha/beta hydrolase [Flavobacteriia bacterium]NCP04848.1 alpha/beta hydrolase [Flavobacteriales bacterium]PIV94290.1 MAG: alpha/beta hydrolase [Flavobacteriaceae bacterium CG17_big_fil_post_rev_8_21_14_2_50_33_15]PIY11961.1 MAG: alpha/beta hydrolase [Flavobacteriaceae bacterium CG_4_10_14_3_um_filter_33_47]PJB16219.1 MAG: alpha/beta hydrolase [Flavobacteriaceae bacterium CG_4_9_14_3_um_filter_33_16]
MDKNSLVIQGKHHKPILIDFQYISNGLQKPIIIFCHGYKGFKDWGAWNLMALTFAEAGFCFIKFNFSHNGGTLKEPIDFPDLEAFGNNNYTKELDDLEAVIDWVFNNKGFENETNKKNITLIGHSRGCGIVSIKAEEDSRIKKLITLAGVSDYGVRFPKGNAFEAWKKNGVYKVENARTKQQMPHYFQFYQDFTENEKRLTIKRAVSNLKIPHLIIHGDADTSVSIEEAKKLHEWNPNSTLKIIKDANHVFGASHPWKSSETPQHLSQAIQSIMLFLS